MKIKKSWIHAKLRESRKGLKKARLAHKRSEGSEYAGDHLSEDIGYHQGYAFALQQVLLQEETK